MMGCLFLLFLLPLDTAFSLIDDANLCTGVHARSHSQRAPPRGLSQAFTPFSNHVINVLLSCTLVARFFYDSPQKLPITYGMAYQFHDDTSHQFFFIARLDDCRLLIISHISGFFFGVTPRKRFAAPATITGSSYRHASATSQTPLLSALSCGFRTTSNTSVSVRSKCAPLESYSSTLRLSRTHCLALRLGQSRITHITKAKADPRTEKSKRISSRALLSLSFLPKVKWQTLLMTAATRDRGRRMRISSYLDSRCVKHPSSLAFSQPSFIHTHRHTRARTSAQTNRHSLATQARTRGFDEKSSSGCPPSVAPNPPRQPPSPSVFFCCLAFCLVNRHL